VAGTALKGSFRPPGDKSISHRVGLFSLLASGTGEVHAYSDCEDCGSTLRVIAQLGSRVRRSDDRLLIEGAGGSLVPHAALDCGNSGTTIRLVLGILAGRPGTYTLDGDASLRRRPLERVAIPLRLMGATLETTAGHAPVTVHGARLKAIDYTLPMASAQLKSALLLAGLQADGPCRIREPAASRDHSERMLRAWGADLHQDGNTVTVAPGRLALPPSFTVPGDASGAAFFICGAAIVPGSTVTGTDVLLNPSRIGWIGVLRRMGARVETRIESEVPESMGTVQAAYAGGLRACEVPADEIPNVVDEIPILAVVATQAQGTSVFRSCGELRVKECDRLAAIVTELGRFGAAVRVEGDDLIVRGPTPLRAPAEPCESYGDHRIAMSARIASLLCDGPVTIRDEACAAVSYPDFARTCAALCGGACP
jgi:3-phosphoshikimate 1-carboxyvinyltransferase